jgi:hypothetical protein
METIFVIWSNSGHFIGSSGEVLDPRDALVFSEYQDAVDYYK